MSDFESQATKLLKEKLDLDLFASIFGEVPTAKSTTAFTSDDLDRLMRTLPDPNPFKRLAREKGFDLEAGDWMVVPEFFFSEIPALNQWRKTRHVRVSPYVENLLLVKGEFVSFDGFPGRLSGISK